MTGEVSSVVAAAVYSEGDCSEEEYSEGGFAAVDKIGPVGDSCSVAVFLYSKAR